VNLPEHGREPLNTSLCPGDGDVCERDPNSGEILMCTYHYDMNAAPNYD
jgi:hypothetical protein